MKLIISTLLISLYSISFISGCSTNSEKRNEHSTNLYTWTKLHSENKPNDTLPLAEEVEKEITFTGSHEVSGEYDTSLSRIEMLFE